MRYLLGCWAMKVNCYYFKSDYKSVNFFCEGCLLNNWEIIAKFKTLRYIRWKIKSHQVMGEYKANHST